MPHILLKIILMKSRDLLRRSLFVWWPQLFYAGNQPWNVCKLKRSWRSHFYKVLEVKVLFNSNQPGDVGRFCFFLFASNKIDLICFVLFSCSLRRKSFSFGESSSRVLFGENRVHSVRALPVFFSDKIASTRIELLGENRFHSNLLMFLSEKIVFIRLGRFSYSFRIKSLALA